MPATPDDAAPQRLVFLHGFTQTHHHWHHVAHLIAAGRAVPSRLAFVDLPGHGLSAHDLDGEIASSGSALADLAGRGTYVGYSLGGRMALTAAMARPDAVRRLVLIGATAGIESESARAARHRGDADLADLVEAIGVDAFLDRWLAAPLFATLVPERRGLDHRRRNTATGLAHSLRRFGTGSMGSLWDSLPTLDIPVLVLAGELDAKFTELGHRLVDVLPRAVFLPVSDAGHAAHTEQPDVTAEAIVTWLDATDSACQPTASPIANKTP